MARRGENIRKRKDGRWEARYICGYAEDGKAKYKSVYRKTYAEVKEARNRMALKQTNKGTLVTFTTPLPQSVESHPFLS